MKSTCSLDPSIEHDWSKAAWSKTRDGHGLRLDLGGEHTLEYTLPTWLVDVILADHKQG